MMETIYKALLTNYRLLCSLLFLEHTLEIQEDKKNGSQRQANLSADGDVDFGESERYFTMQKTWHNRTNRKRNMGYLLGLSCVFVQVGCLVDYFLKLCIDA